MLEAWNIWYAHTNGVFNHNIMLHEMFVNFCLEHTHKTHKRAQVLQRIQEVNENCSVHGLIVQLPLDSVHRIDTEKVTNAVAPQKDVDG